MSLYCALASNSISFGYDGTIRPCCAVDTYFWPGQTRHQLKNYYNDVVKWVNNA
jgi:hypothetical protein